MRAHKFLSTVVIIMIIGGGYYWFHNATSTSATLQYVISRARLGSITQTVSGSGQVSAQNQTDVKSTVSGAITSINVAVGDHIKAGDLLATVDSSQAALSLQNAKISYAKLTEPAKPADISNAQDNLTKSYSDGYNAISGVFSDLPNIMNGMKNLLYSQTGFLSNVQIANLSLTAQGYQNTFSTGYDQNVIQYSNLLQAYKQLTRASATSSINQMIVDTYTLLKQISQTLQEGQSAVTFVSTSQPLYQPSVASAAATNINTWSSQINSDLASVLSAQNSIQSNTNTLNTLINGADPLDVQAQQVSLSQQEQTYANYFIRSPFDGVVGRILVNKYDQASGATIATIIGDNKIATISLNEVDAAKVNVGQPATITFSAINGFTATGTVSQVDLVGTVTQGVVSYNVKININTSDPRIKPGMSVSTTIITMQKDGVLVVPSTAIKSQGQSQYVQVLEKPILPTASSTGTFGSSTQRFNRSQYASSTNTLGSSTNSFGSSTNQFGSTGRSFGGGRNATITATSLSVPIDQIVTLGDTDGTNTEITGGLTPGLWVVTRTITSGQTTTTAAPSILSSLGGGARGLGGGGGGGGGVRGGSATPAAAPRATGN